MKKDLVFLFIFVLRLTNVLAGLYNPAKYADAFLSGGVGARSSSMGGAYSAVAEDVTALYWNPAGLACMKQHQLHGMHSERFSGLINSDFIGIGLSMGNESALAVGLFRLGVDQIPITRLKDPRRSLGEFYVDDQGLFQQNVPTVSKNIHDQETAFYISYGKKKSSKWNWGSSVKIIHKSTGDFSAWGLGFDFGVLLFPYRTMKVGLMFQDATSTLIAWGGKRKEMILPHLKIGMCYPFTFFNVHFTPDFDVDVLFENRKKTTQMTLGRTSFDSHAGLEARLFRRIRLSAGLDRGYFTLGTGLDIYMMRVDYSFIPNEELGNGHRISVSFLFDKRKFH